MSNDFSSLFFDFLKEWHTLFSAILALVAAFFTIRQMRIQQRADAARALDDLNRKRMAVRAQLPDALSELLAYINKVVNNELSDANEPIAEPIASLTKIKNSIEFLHNEAALRAFELASWYQVWKARLGGRGDWPKPILTDALYDSALLTAYVHSLFDYARGETDVVNVSKPSKEEMRSGLRAAVGFLTYQRTPAGKFAGVLNIIDRRHGD